MFDAAFLEQPIAGANAVFAISSPRNCGRRSESGKEALQEIEFSA